MLDFVLILLVIIFTLIYLYGKYQYTYWDRREIKSLKPTFLFGNYGKLLQKKASLTDVVKELYNSTTEPYIGVYSLFNPILIVRDLKLVRQILVQDFGYFPNRGIHHDEEYDPLTGHLFVIDDLKWKNMRAKLTPTFSTGKLKAMCNGIVECSKKLDAHLQNVAEQDGVIEIRELAACHSTNNIASIAFGIEIDCIADQESEFRRVCQKIFEPSVKNVIRNFVRFVNPKMMRYLFLHAFDPEVEEFFRRIVKSNMEYREKNDVVRKDFFQLLIQLKNGIDVTADDRWTNTKNNNEKASKLTFDEILAQAFVFYIGGFETSGTAIAWCLREVANQPEIQRRIHDEIDQVLERFDGEINYESLGQMKYLESCIEETLRMYPPGSILFRKCSRDYRLPGTKALIEKGTIIHIPAIGLHRDPQYYPEPDKFKPERFSEASKADPSFKDRPYFPFGDGPRNCIALRLGKLQVKVAIVILLRKYSYEVPEEEKNRVIPLAVAQFIMAPGEDMHLKIRKRF